ncbi:MAG: helix-turn-helix domain-containing protein [Planctomycetota bacterium]|jgi:excisionase family DNA binding protein
MTQRSGQLLVTAQEAAKMLSISERTLWTLTKAGKLPCVMLGSCKRYSIRDIEDFVLNNTKNQKQLDDFESNTQGSKGSG